MGTLPTVFIVDDDDGSREAVAALVRSLPAAIETFDSAEAFLPVFKPSRAGCLVLDVRMPGLSGLELCAELAARENQMPVILTTAYGDVPMAVRALREGAFMFLQKPCREHELWETIRDALAWDQRNRDQRQRIADIQARLAALTDEERSVMEMVLADLPCRAIAKRLGIGMRTAQARRAAVFHKMSAESLPHLAVMIQHLRGSQTASVPRQQSA